MRAEPLSALVLGSASGPSPAMKKSMQGSANVGKSSLCCQLEEGSENVCLADDSVVGRILSCLPGLLLPVYVPCKSLGLMNDGVVTPSVGYVIRHSRL